MRRGGIIDRATRIVLSDELRKTLGHPYKRFVFFRFLKRKIGDRYTPRDQGPLPPPELIVNEALMHRSEEHTSELQSLMRISYAVFCLKKKTNKKTTSIQSI